jgi:hypothetical protein
VTDESLSENSPEAETVEKARSGIWILISTSRAALSGYPKDGGSDSQRYLAYVKAMERFSEDCAKSGDKKPDALDLDAFFYNCSEKLKKYQKAF